MARKMIGTRHDVRKTELIYPSPTSDLAHDPRWKPLEEHVGAVWTDDFSNIVPVINWNF